MATYEYKIIICESCSGKGIVRNSELTNYHKSEYNEWTETCKNCLGSGRMDVTITKVEKPYIQPKPEK